HSRARHRDAEASGADHLGSQAAQRRQVHQRRGLQRRVREVQPRAGEGPEAPRVVELQADRVGRDRRSVHDSRSHQQTVADVSDRHDVRAGVDVPSEGVQGQAAGRHLASAHRHGPLQVRALVEGRRSRARGQRRLVARRAQDQNSRVSADSRRRRARRPAAERRERRGGEHSAASREPDRKPPKLFLTTAPSIRTIQLMFQTHNFDEKTHMATGVYDGPTKDKRVRQAIQYALDVDEIVKGVLDGKATRQATMLTPLHFGYDPALKPIKQDLAKVKKLLAEAGYPNGVEITLNGPQGRYVRDKEGAQAAAGQLNKAGIKTTANSYEPEHYLHNLTYKQKGGPVWLIGWGTPTSDAEPVYNPLFHNGSNLGTYFNSDLDGLMDAAQKEMDEKKRLALYHQINKLWIEDAAAAPLYQQLDLYGASKRITWKARSDERIKAVEM